MKILAFGASNSRQSINAKLARYAAERLRETLRPACEIDHVDLNDYEMPIYSIDRENADGIPQLAEDFYAKIGGADALIISYAEHNGLYTVAWKNIFDWMSRINQKVFQDKPMVIFSTSPGGGGGQNVLQTALSGAPFFGAEIKGSHSVGRWPTAFVSDTQTLAHAEDIEAIDAALAALVA